MDDDIGASQIPVMWQCISITIQLAKQVHLCKMYAFLPLLFHFLELLMHAFLMRSCYVIILVQCNLFVDF